MAKHELCNVLIVEHVAMICMPFSICGPLKTDCIL